MLEVSSRAHHFCWKRLVVETGGHSFAARQNLSKGVEGEGGRGSLIMGI